MNIILKQIWDFLKQKNRWAIALIVLLLLIGIGVIKIQRNKINDWKDKYKTEVKLKDALIDSVKFYKNSYGEVVAEKLTIQESIKNLEKMYGQLSDSQKELITRVKELDKKSNTLAAALVTANVGIHNLMLNTKPVIDTTNKKITFGDLYKKTIDSVNYEVLYKFVVGNVLPFPQTAIPTLFVDTLQFPNKQFISFSYKDDKKKGNPISFSVSNSNGFYKTIDINSYAIPTINTEPKSKFGEWVNKNSKMLMYVGVGAAGGIVTYKVLTK
jgi:hypothetical protein